jgi:hypothetical protein
MDPEAEAGSFADDTITQSRKVILWALNSFSNVKFHLSGGILGSGSHEQCPKFIFRAEWIAYWATYSDSPQEWAEEAQGSQFTVEEWLQHYAQ